MSFDAQGLVVPSGNPTGNNRGLSAYSSFRSFDESQCKVPNPTVIEDEECCVPPVKIKKPKFEVPYTPRNLKLRFLHGPPERYNRRDLNSIMNLVARHTRIDVNTLKAKGKLKPIAQARQLYFYLANRYTNESLTSISRNCGGRDHTTVLHGKWVHIFRRRALGKHVGVDCGEIPLSTMKKISKSSGGWR